MKPILTLLIVFFTLPLASQWCSDDLLIEILSTSLGSPFSGPFLPGEEVEIRYTIQTYHADPVSTGNNCQWLQGIVPEFGNGWDPSSFDAQGQPHNIVEPITAFNGADDTWNWNTEITYNYSSLLFSIGDFDDDPHIDICHSTEDDCDGIVIAEDDIISPGWFASQMGGDPNETFGDGICCNCTMGPWSLTFKLITRSSNFESNNDATLKFYTFADGQTGSWHTPFSVCENDVPAIFEAAVDCYDGANIISEPYSQICQDITTIISFDADAPYSSINYTSVDGSISGNENPWILNIENTTEDIKTYEFEVELISEVGCAGETTVFTIDVLPQVAIQFNDEVYCEVDTFDIGGNPTATSYTESMLSYEWSIAGIGNISNPEVYIESALTYSLTVTDENNCYSSAENTIAIQEEIEINIVGDIEVCNNNPVRNLSTDIANPDVEWTVNNMSQGNYNVFSLNFSDFNVDELEVVATLINNSCLYSDTIILYRNPIPVFEFNLPNPSILCEPGEVSLVPELYSTYADLSYEWTGPGLFSFEPTVNVSTTGLYELQIESDNGCLFNNNIMLIFDDSPEYEIIGNSISCTSSETLTFFVQDTFETINWLLDDQLISTEDTIFLTGIEFGAGNHTLEAIVENVLGCISNPMIELQLAVNDLSISILDDSLTYCSNNTNQLFLENIDESTLVTWTNPASELFQDTVEITETGQYSVKVSTSNDCNLYDTVHVDLVDPTLYEIQGDEYSCGSESISLFTSPSLQGDITWLVDGNTINSQYDTIYIDNNLLESGFHQVTAIIVDSNTCTQIIEREVFINLKEAIELPQSSTVICSGDSITLQIGNNSGLPLETTWLSPSGVEVGDSIVADQQGYYQVELSIGDGCTISDSFYLEVIQLQNTVISGPPSSCSQYQTVDLFIADSVNLNTEWLVDNISLSLQNNVSLSFAEFGFGSHEVLVNISGENGCQAEISTLVYLDTLQDIDLASLEDSISTCNEIVIKDSIQLLESYDVEWISPSGNNSNDSILVDETGTYNVIISNDYDCTVSDSIFVSYDEIEKPIITGNSLVCFNATSTLEIDGSYDSILWNTLESTTSIEVPAGMYSVTIIDSNMCISQSVGYLVFQEPEIAADFTAGFQGLEVTFTNTSSTGEFYSWDFGDEVFSDEENPSHIYEVEGDYTVSLITSTANCADTIVKNVSVFIDNLVDVPFVHKLFPNPSNGKFVIEYTRTSQPEAISIVGITGESYDFTMQVQGDAIMIDTDLASGVYYISYEVASRRYSKRLVIVK